MNKLLPLVHREWLQNRFAWTLLALVPVGLALLLVSLAELQFGDDALEHMGDGLPLMLATVSIIGTTVAVFVILCLTSLLTVPGLARRDHQDHSIAFWLSLPVGHARSLGVPLAVHLLLVPAAAVLVGLAGGLLISLPLVTRLVGFGAWLALPWPSLLLGSGLFALRLIAGLPLALMWLSPLVLLCVLASALFKRWGVAVVAVGLGLGAAVLDHLLGWPVLGTTLATLARQAGFSLMGASGRGMTIQSGQDASLAVQQLPGWALHDFSAAVQALASPVLLGSLLTSALLFGALVAWRRKGAGA